MSFSEINSYYDSYSVYREYGLNKIEVKSSTICEFGKTLSSFCWKLDELEIGYNWKDFTSHMKKFFFFLCTSPVSPKNLESFIDKTFIIDNILKSKNNFDDETKSLLENLCLNYNKLFSDLPTNPLLRAFEEVIKSNELGDKNTLSFLFPTYSFKFKNILQQFFEQFFMEQGLSSSVKFEIVTYAQARNVFTLYDFTCLFGSPKWFQKVDEFHLLSTPKSKELLLFAYSHFDNITPDIDFFNFDDTKNKPKLPENELEFIHDEQEVDPLVQDDLIRDFALPSISVNLTPSPLQDNEPACDAYHYTLYGEKFIYNDSEGSFFTIEYDESINSFQCNSIARKKCAEVSGGDIILISSSGGGDMIKPTANNLLVQKWGEQNFNHRIDLQEEWKIKLRNLYLDLGPHITKHLEKRAVYADLSNIRYWVSKDGIGPAEEITFQKLLESLGFDHCMDEIIATVKEIRAAHQKAGRQLATKLRSSIVGKPLNILRNNGVQIFSHPDIEGTQSAYLVEKRNSDIVKIQQHLLLQIHEIKTNEWL